MIDDSDVDAAYHSLLVPPRRNVRRNLAITLVLLAAAVPVGLAVNWLAADLANGRAWLVLVLAVAVAAMAELFRYVGVQG